MFLFPIISKNRLSIIFSLIISFWLFCSPLTAQAATEEAPEKCNTGIFITSLYDLKPALNTFRANFWLWSTCPSENNLPMKNIEVIKAQKVFSNLQFHEKKDGLYWSQRQFQAVIHHKWNFSNFPFERQVLKIELEDGVNDATSLVYVPDIKNSTYNPKIKLDGLKITDFKLHERKISYPTTFGDPSLSKPNSNYSRLVASITVARSGLSGFFFKLHAATYIAFALTLVSFFLHPTQASIFSARMSLLVGSLFAVVVNLRAAGAILGHTNSLTLVDKIHITTMVYIFSAVTISAFSFRFCELGREKLCFKFNKICFLVFSISFFTINLILISSAALGL